MRGTVLSRIVLNIFRNSQHQVLSHRAPTSPVDLNEKTSSDPEDGAVPVVIRLNIIILDNCSAHYDSYRRKILCMVYNYVHVVRHSCGSVTRGSSRVPPCAYFRTPSCAFRVLSCIPILRQPPYAFRPLPSAHTPDCCRVFRFQSAAICTYNTCPHWRQTHLSRDAWMAEGSRRSKLTLVNMGIFAFSNTWVLKRG